MADQISAPLPTGYATKESEGNPLKIYLRGSLPSEHIEIAYTGATPTVSQAVEFAIQGRQQMKPEKRTIADEVYRAMHARAAGIVVIATVYQNGDRSKPVTLNSSQIRSTPVTEYVNPTTGEFSIGVTTDDEGGVKLERIVKQYRR